MGAPKKVTVSYWYKLIAHFGFAKGPVDAMLEWRGGDRVIWKGNQTTSGIISVNKPDLYGGESAEGGVVGDFELMMGNHDQAPNSYLAGIFGALQSAYRGRLTGVLRGAKIGAGNPYPKAFTFKFRRILKGWDDDVCWYPEKAAIPFSGDPGEASVFISSVGGGGGIVGFVAFDDLVFPGGPDLPAQVRLRVRPASENDTTANRIPYPRRFVYEMTATSDLVWDSGWIGLSEDQAGLDAALTTAGRTDLIGTLSGTLEASTIVDFGGPIAPTALKATLYCAKPTLGFGEFFLVAEVRTPGADDTQAIGMNPAHILYDSITSRKENGGMGEPTGRINEASFEAAADKAYTEGFALCTTWKGGESAEQFQQRICNVTGWNCSQDILDGQYYIDMLRGDYVLDDLPVITDDDILDWKAEPNSLTEAVNHLSVAWYDQEKMESRVTTPIQSLGAIESAGGVIPDVREYYEIPYEMLALRVADRDLAAVATPQWRFQVVANRRALALRRPGRYFRLMAPNRGFADMVCVVSEIGFGSFDNGAIQFSAVQDVFSLKDTVFVQPQDSLDDPPGGVALPPPDSIAIETPYVELASALATADREALTEESGYLQIGASRPTGALNYAVASRIAGGEFEVAGSNADWTPTALMAESLLVGVPETVIAYTNGSLLDNVVVGTWAMWGDEMVRVDDIDQDADTMTLARGVGDTTPKPHVANERIWFIGDWYGTDNKEYAAGEEVQAKALTRTGQDQLSPDAAATLTVEMNSRQARPYPPGKLRVTDVFSADEAYPLNMQGELQLTWAHRDRVLQADQLVPEGDASVGPEAGVSYTVRFYVDDVLDEEETGISGTASTPVTLSADGLVRAEVWAVIDSLESWQPASAEFEYLVSAAEARITDAGNTRITDSGNRRITD